MAFTENDVRLCINGLDSGSSVERKKSMDRLRELVNDRRTVVQLNNALKRTSNTVADWSFIFNSVHRMLLQETDRIRAEVARRSITSGVKSKRENFKNDCSSLVVTIVNKANQDMPRIKCSDLVGSVLQVLDSDYLRDNYADKYIEIVRNRIMPYRKYWNDLTSDHWSSLLNTFLNLLKSPPHKSERSSIVEVLNGIIYHGSRQSCLGITFKTKFPLIAECFVDEGFYSARTVYQECLLHVSITLCLQLAKDSRVATCQFGESILMPVISLYDKFSMKKMNTLFDFLLLQMHLHHPQGVSRISGAAYAYNWDNWHQQLKELYAVVESEINRVQEVKYGFSKETALHPVFLQFAVEVCKQVSENSSDVLDVHVYQNDEDVPSSSAAKRRRVAVGVQAIMDMLRTFNDPQYTWPWLSLLCAFMTKYPGSVKKTEFVPLVQLMAELLSTCKDSLVMNYLCECCISLLKVEVHLGVNTLDYQVVNPLWQKIWESTLRTVGLNQSVKDSHKLLQSLIVHDKAVRPMELVHLFTSGTVKLSVSSIQTLGVLNNRYDVTDAIVPWTMNSSQSVKFVQSALLDWLLPNRDDTDHIELHFESSVLSKILIELILKTRISNTKEPFSTHEKLCNVSTILDSIDQNYILTCFENGLMVPETNKGRPEIKNETQIVLVNTVNRDRLMELLIRDCDSLILKLMQGLEAISEAFNLISLLLYIWSWMLKINILKMDLKPSFSEKLQCLMEKVSTSAIDILKNFNTTSSNSVRDEILKGLKQLFSFDYHPVVTHALREMIPNGLMDILLYLAKTKSVENADLIDDMMDFEMDIHNGHVQEYTHGSTIISIERTISSNGFLPLSKTELLSSSQQLQLEAAKVICYYCSNSGGQKVQNVEAYLTELLKLYSSKNSNIECFANFSIVVEVIKCVLHACTLEQIHVKHLLFIMQSLCRAWHSDGESISVVLQLLQGLLLHVHNIGKDIDKENTITLLKGILKSSNKKKFGPKVVCRFIECLGELAKVDPTASWSTWDCGTSTLHSIEPTPIVEESLIFLNSPFHEVRMSAVKSISILLSTLPTDLQWQKRIFDNLCNIVMDSFIVEGNLTPQETEEEAVNRSACALHALATPIVVSPLLRKRGLFAILKLVKVKNLNGELVHKVLRLVGESLNLKSFETFMATNLQYLLTHWHREKYKLQEFPYLLLSCKSEMEFYSKYQEIIIPELMQKDDDDGLQIVCDRTGIALKALVEACYPHIMARVLPYFSVHVNDKSSNITEQNVNAAKLIYSKMQHILTDANIKILHRQHLANLIVGIIKLLHDPIHFSQLTDWKDILIEPNEPFFNIHVTTKSLQYIQENSPAPDSPVVVFLAKKLPGYIQSILLQLGVSIHCSPTQDDKVQAFHQYCTFAYILALELNNSEMITMSHYIVRDVLHTLIYIVKQSYKNYEATLTVAACHFLQKFCEKCLPSCAAIVSKFLIVIVSVLVPLAKIGNDIGLEALTLLKFLIIEKSDCLSSAIKLLDPFPADAVFHDMKSIHRRIKYDDGQYSLQEEIKHFLNADKTNLGCRAEGLQHLRTQLSQRKDELKVMYDELKNIRGFSEDCANSVLHQLICTLVELASISDERVSLEAARCLGELGPADLTTMVLRPESKQDMSESIGSGELLQAFISHVVCLLAGYLVDEDIHVVQATSAALYIVLGYKEAQHAVENNLFKPNDYLVPFINSKKAKQNTQIAVNEEHFKISVDHLNLWCPADDCNHETWITKLVCSILESFHEDHCFLPQLMPVCKAKVSFSENILPVIVALVLSKGSDDCCAVIWKHMRHFFHQHFTMHARLRREHSTTSTASLKYSYDVCLNKASVQCMLDIVHLVRLQPSFKKKQTARNEIEVDLNYLHVAQAAQFCSAYFTSILYTELWCGAQLRNTNYMADTFCQSTTTLEYICDKNPQNGTVVQNILWEAYMKIGNTDAVYGCGSSHLLDPRTRTRHYELVGNWGKVWDKVMLTYDVELASGKIDATRGLLNALQKCSLHHVLNSYLKSLEPEIKCNQDDFQYECAWRLAQWDTMTATTNNRTTYKQDFKTSLSGEEFEKYHFLCLKAINEADHCAQQEAVANARSCVVESLAHASLESSRNLYRALSRLQEIQEIEDFASALKLKNDLKAVMEKWKNQDERDFNEFEYIEPIWWQRAVMLNIACREEGEMKLQIIDILANVYLNMAALARNEGYHQVAARCHGAVSQILEHTPNLVGKLKLDEAQLAWERGDVEVGKYLLRSLLANFSAVAPTKDEDRILYSSALKLYGDWMVETKSENPQVIMNNYFLKAQKMVEKIGSRENNNLLEIYWSLARFSDAEYQQLLRYTKSSMYEMKKEWIDKASEDAEALRKQSSITKDDQRTIRILERQSRIDMTEIENLRKEMNTYLTYAMMYYLWGLKHGDKNNLHVFRVASLWLDNRLHEGLTEIVRKNLPQVPSYKFVPLLPQLTPRMSNIEDTFSSILNKLLERCAEDHPHHTLPLILALANSYKDRDYMEACASSQNIKTHEPRVLGAQQMIKKLHKKSVIGPLLTKMEQVATALISLANLEVKIVNRRTENYIIPESERLHKLKDLNSVLVPTLTIPVKVNCQYTDIIGIHSFQSSFGLVGGINAPKKISCTGSDGIARPQLVKGQDDLRQDAVMQQVFTIMNMFLKNNKDTSKQKLLIRTYKVVPLSQRSGVIEWCQNTQPLLVYLSGGDHKSGAHKKYYPEDLTSLKCREKMRIVAAKSNEKKLEVYKEICESVHPVFHYFFLENFPTPGVWFERRLAYIHSVATSSMIGYILGLGDRHTLNILIDNITAEVIHIDFGIAFEMGHILPTPETVPFRLTREIVDGMGVCGIEGVFRRSCEKTMAVLRQNQATILTILEVLLYDPLYAWTITPTKAYNLQRSLTETALSEEDESAVEVNKMAERALFRLQQKLQGVEEGTTTSVAGQVSHLLQQASDAGNLSRLYFGWQPYL